MIRLLHIEWLKISQSRYFKVMVGLWLAAFLIVPFGIDAAIDWLNDQGNLSFGGGTGLGADDLPIFSFTDIWHNLAWTYKLITILLSIIIVVNIGQEWEEKTMRQNIIDGLSRNEYFASKLLLIVAFSLLSTLLLLVMGLILGFSFSHDTSISAIVGHIDFLFGYFLHVLLQLNLAFLVINLLRKVGLTIVLFLIYWFFLEPMVNGILSITMPFNVGQFLPLEAASNLLPWPFSKYVLTPTIEHISSQSVWIALGWIAITVFLNRQLTIRRDLR